MPRPRALPVLAVVALFLASGCLGADDADDPAPPPPPTNDTKDGSGEGVDGDKNASAPEPPVTVLAPWWTEGDYFEVTFEGADRPARTHRLVTFHNDSETRHFWLGVADRALAMEHAFFDTNPFLGRIHYDVLAPHESGRHATMYDFPVHDGKMWQGFFFGRDWDFTATADPAEEGRFLVVGEGTDGSTIRYDYDPDVRWFNTLEITAPDGTLELKGTMKAHGSDAKGTYYFVRGRDYYEGPRESSGTHTEPFEVEDEGLDTLAFDIAITTTAPLTLEILDPEGHAQWSTVIASPTGGEKTERIEIESPVQGEWSVRYASAGEVTGRITGIGVYEYVGTV